MLEGGAEGGIAFPKGGGKVPFSILGKYLRYFKKSLYVHFNVYEAKIMNYEPIEKDLTMKSALPPHHHSHRFNIPAKN